MFTAAKHLAIATLLHVMFHVHSSQTRSTEELGMTKLAHRLSLILRLLGCDTVQSRECACLYLKTHFLWTYQTIRCHKSTLTKNWMGPCSGWRNRITRRPMGWSLFWDVTLCWLVVTDVSEQPIGPILNSEAAPKQKFFLDCLTLEDGTERLPATITEKCVNIPEEQRPHLHRGGRLKSCT